MMYVHRRPSHYLARSGVLAIRIEAEKNFKKNLCIILFFPNFSS